MRRALLAAGALAALSLLVVAPAPTYDPWAWLLWGREVADGTLDTREGPAFKPLPVAVCAVLAPLGEAAPVVWVWLVRAAALVVLWLAFRLGRRLAGGAVTGGTTGEAGGAVAGGTAGEADGVILGGTTGEAGGAAAGRVAGETGVAVMGGVLAAVAVALCGRFLAYSAAGAEPALLLAAALGGAEAWRAGRPRLALACAAACGLVRVETWPFLLAGGALLWRRGTPRPALALGAALIPAAWFVPELIGSGDVLRSGARARVPNPGQPALADIPAAASLAEAARLVLWPVWLGVAALAVAARSHPPSRRALLPAGAGAAWIAIVALMAQAGFSGEARYALPGAALVGMSGAAGLALAARRAPWPAAAVALAAMVVAVPAGGRAGDLPAVRQAQAYQWRLATELADVLDAAGGRAAVLACGRPYVGPFRGPLFAYRLDVAKAAVEPDAPPRRPAVTFESALTATAARTPQAPRGARTVAHSSLWRVRAACGY